MLRIQKNQVIAFQILNFIPNSHLPTRSKKTHRTVHGALMEAATTKLGRALQQRRTFINARVKWVSDPYLDEPVQREKNLKQVLFLKDRIVSSPSKSLPLASLSLLKPLVNLPMTAAAFFQKYPSVFTTFQPSSSFPLHVRLTPQALALHREEETIHLSPPHRNVTVQRLTKFLMLTGAGSLPLDVVDRFRFDLGLPHDYITSLIGDYPDYFEVTEIKNQFTGEKTLALAVSSRRDNLAVSEMERREATVDGFRVKKGLRIRYSMNFPKGYELDKRVKNWVEQWQNLPYISPYENAFHLGPSSDQAEKWAVAVLHELLCLLVSKKTETDNLLCLGEYLGFGIRFKKALVHHPVIFYMSHKIRTQTVVLREAYHKVFLIERHPLMGMRHRYIYLMSKSGRGKKRDSVHRTERSYQKKRAIQTCEDGKYEMHIKAADYRGHSWNELL